MSSNRVNREMGGVLTTLAGNVGLQSLNQPVGEGTLKEAPQWEIGNVLLGECCLSHGIKNG